MVSDDSPLPSPHSRPQTPKGQKGQKGTTPKGSAPGRVEIIGEELEVDIRLRVMVDQSCEMMRNMGCVLIFPREKLGEMEEDLWNIPVGVLQERVEAAAAKDLELALVVSHLLGPSGALMKGPAAALKPRSRRDSGTGTKHKLPVSMTLQQLAVPRMVTKLVAECNMVAESQAVNH